MTQEVESEPSNEPEVDAHALSPLPGEAGIPSVARRPRAAVSKKGLLAIVLLLASLVVGVACTIQRISTSGKKPDDAELKLMRDRPAAATTQRRKLEWPSEPITQATAIHGTTSPTPVVVHAQDLAEPAAARTHGIGTSSTPGPPVLPPEDAPVMLVSGRMGALTGATTARGHTPSGPVRADAEEHPGRTDPLEATARNLESYQRQLEGVMDTLTRSATQSTDQVTGGAAPATLLGTPPFAGNPLAGVPGGGALLGGHLPGSSTPKVSAAMLGNRSLTLPKGTAFTCALKTKVISAASGLVGCQVQRNLYSDDGRVLLVERGSHLDGEYRVATLRPGTVRIPVLWTRIRTPLGVTVDLDSPGTGQLGESGMDGHVDNRWSERIGAAMLLSLIDDSVKLLIQNQADESRADTIVLPSTTANTSKLAEKVLDSTINIPPLIYQNQGGIVGIYVARDVDFSSVYELMPVQR